MHTRAIRIEDSRDSDLDIVRAMVVKEHCFSSALTFVIAGTRANRVYAAPIFFSLWMHFRITVNFTGGGL